jgi:3-hydroxyacyl-CoA dehydrogenase
MTAIASAARSQPERVRKAICIVQEGIADPADVDLAARTGFGLRMPAYGISEHMDNAGLPLVFSNRLRDDGTL